ncbi:MAG: BamA/TamA family outer membrane protein, partial [Bdellovibrionales bacterium]|nr:BamA/TamA family outer membrane protein [Bdellovibrionales bacterium]
KRFGTVTIGVRPIFDPPENRAFEALNSTKTTTREGVIRRELLFKEGDKFDPFLVSESERVLRGLGYLRDVKLRTVERDGGIVDVEVDVQDTWTIIPQFSFSSGDGRTKRSFGISEGNLMGRGKRAELLYREEEKSDAIQFAYDDRRLFGSRYQGQFAVADGSEGTAYLYDVGDPFRSLVQENAWGHKFFTGDTIERLYRSGEERFVYRKESDIFGGQYAFALGDPSDSVDRFSLGFQYSYERFNPATISDLKDIGVDPKDLPENDGELAEDRKFIGPTVGFELIEQDFIKRRYIDRFSRFEDFNLGLHVRGSLFVAPTLLGSEDDTFLLHASVGDGYLFEDEDFLRWELSTQSRYTVRSDIENSIFTLASQYYYPVGPVLLENFNLGNHTLASQFRLDYSETLDADREFLVGANNFLRGYDAHTFTGDKRIGINLEDRIHIIENAFDLVSLGFTFFAEAGGATSDSFGRLVSDRIYSDVGMGLRLAFPKSTGERVMRIDFAFPLRAADDGSDRLELRVIFSGGQLFDSKLPTERSDAERVGVDLGL